jgi:hypothetical protein
MEPIPETDEALAELERFGDVELRGDLQRLTALAQARVPGLVGVSLGLVAEDLVLTYVASGMDVAALDAVQYADDGPCVEAVREGETVRTDAGSLLDEGRWLLFAQAIAAAGIRSTLSIPFRRGGVITGGVNLYGDAGDTFDGRVEELSDLFGAWAPGAVANADLSFATRLEAVRSPERLRGQAYLDQAMGLLVGALDVEPAAAEDRMKRAAAQAGVTVPVLARALVEAFDPDA